MSTRTPRRPVKHIGYDLVDVVGNGECLSPTLNQEEWQFFNIIRRLFVEVEGEYVCYELAQAAPNIQTCDSYD